MTRRASIRVRYGEVDQQGVVFNAHYLAYVDDVFDTWLRELDADFEALGWEIMLKTASMEWHAQVSDYIVATTWLKLVAAREEWSRACVAIAFAGACYDLERARRWVGVDTELQPGCARPRGYGACELLAAWEAGQPVLIVCMIYMA